MKDPCSNFVSLHSFPEYEDLHAGLYIEVLIINGIGGKQIDLLLENLVVDKPVEKLWDEVTTLRSLFSSWSPPWCCIQYQNE